MMHLLAINWAVVGVKAAQLILSFSILVVLHELGHFLPAKWFGCRVEKFYLFFNPWFSLAKKKVGETEYGLGWIPFGGYVKISGMIDESMDKDQMKQPAQNWEFRSKPAWQRLIIMLGGVTVNVILAIVIFIGITWKWGEDYLPPQNVTYGLAADSLGKVMGLRDGDVVTHVDGKPLQDEMKLTMKISTGDAKQVTVQRDGQPLVLQVPNNMVSALNANRFSNFASVRTLAIVKLFADNSPAEKAGLQKGDRLIGIDSIATPYTQDFQRILRERKTGTLGVRVQRGDQQLSIPVTLNKDGMIGVQFESDPAKLGLKAEHRSYTLGEAIPAGIRRCGTTLSTYLAGLRQLVTGKAKAKDSLGSIISFGSVFPGEWDWQAFWTLTGIFSIILAFMNVLPIPALDGGHALFTIYEMITGRKPGDKFMEYAQMVGMVLLLGLMAYALGLDIWRIFRKG